MDALALCWIEFVVLYMCHMCLSGVWLGVNLGTNTKKDVCATNIGLCAKKWLIVLDTIVELNGWTYMIVY